MSSARETLIEALVDFDAGGFEDDEHESRMETVRNWIRNGLRGYEDFTTEELLEAYQAGPGYMTEEVDA